MVADIRMVLILIDLIGPFRDRNSSSDIWPEIKASPDQSHFLKLMSEKVGSDNERL